MIIYYVTDGKNKPFKGSTDGIGCEDGIWTQVGPITCYEPPVMPDFLEAQEIKVNVTITCMQEETGYPDWETDGQFAQILYE